MFDWITKPYIQWNFIDSIICIAEVLILFIMVLIIVGAIQDIINKRRKKVKNNGQSNTR